jgi:hypothetical protein
VLWEVLKGIYIREENDIGFDSVRYLGGVADFEETGSSIEDCGVVSLAWSWDTVAWGERCVPMGISAMLKELTVNMRLSKSVIVF